MNKNVRNLTVKNSVIWICCFAVSGVLEASTFPGMEIPEIAAKAAEITALEAEKGTLLAARETSKGVLKTFEATSGLAIEGMRAVFKGITSTVQINGMSAHVAPLELASGKLPNVKLRATILGKKEDISGLTFNFKSPEKSIEEMVKLIVDKINVLNL